jgi:hypothetical protein
MIRLFFRLIFVALCVTLVASTWAQASSSTGLFSIHDTFDRYRPWLREIRLGSMFAVLILCLVTAGRDPLFTRIGVLSVIVSLAVMLTPPREIHQAVQKIDGIRLEPQK